jgi:glycosyltransferase involved in cell wall biosynthesis
VSKITVAAETAYPISAASARVRLAAFAPHLERHGAHLGFKPALTDEEYLAISSEGHPARKAANLARGASRLVGRELRRSDADLLLIHRLRFLMPLPRLEPARNVDAYDFDDALYVGSILPSNRGFSWLKREAEHWLSYVRRARLVIAGNAHLADRARAHASHVEVVPSCVDPTRQPTREHQDRETITIGWIGSRSTTDDLRSVLPAIKRVGERGPMIRLVVVGAEDLGLRETWLEQRPWSPATEADELAGFDIGIMPLPDNEWTRGKCGYKLLQYFAAGVPAVASPVGVNTALLGSGERGLPARTPSEWAAGLERLAGDHETRREMGATARRFVEREFSYQRWAPELASMLRGL